MVTRFRAFWTAIFILCAGAACKRGGSCTEETARQGVIDYLSKRAGMNVAGMNVQVTSLTCRQNDADAMVAFTARGPNAGQPMTRRYTLEHQGGRWVVTKSSDTALSPHGAGSTVPGTPLPPGHPAVSTAQPKQ
jgi:hypothetical protein